MNKQITSKTLVVLLILLVPVILYLLNFKLLLFDTDFYAAEFKEQGVYGKFENADEINGKLLDYFTDEEEIVDIDIYTGEEKQHLLDVKILIKKSFAILNSILIISLLLLTALFALNKSIEPIPKILIGGGILTICFTIIDLLFSIINFDFSFDLFHRMFFEGRTWLFSEGSSLIGIYPAGFFYAFAKQMLFNITTHGFILVLIGFLIWILLLNKKITKKENYLKSFNKKYHRK